MDVISAGQSPQTGRTIDSDSRSLSESTPSLQPFSGTDSSFHSPKHGGSNGGSGSELSGSGVLDGRDPEDIKARVERKRLEHERQRALQRQAFEQQMKALEAQQREEEANLLHQQVVGAKPRTTGGAESAPTTPPFGSTKAASLVSSNVRASSNSSPRHAQLSLDEDIGGAQEGLNGSNVPGLPPPTGARAAAPGARRSAGPEDIAAGVRRNLADGVTGAFDRLSIGHRSVNQLRPHDGGPRTAPLTGQQAVLQRAMARGNDATPSESTGFTPVFGERFLFDDELDAEDSAFVKKYNLQEDDDKFPVLIHRDSYPGMLSASSAALDLAPLQQTPPRVGGRGTDGASKMSEWPQFREGDQSDHRLSDLDRRGRSERSSPRLSIAPAVGVAQRQASIPLPSPSARVASTGAVNGRISPSLSTGGLVPNSARVVSAGQVPSNNALVSSIDGRGSATGTRFVSQGHHRLSQHFSDSGDQQQGSQSSSPQRSTDQHLQASQQLSQPSPQQAQHDLQAQQQQSGQQQQQPLQRQGDTFPSFTMEAFANAPSGARSPGHFPPYGGTVPGARAVSAEHSRPSSGYFDAFANPTPGQAGLFGTQQATNKFGLAPLNDNHLLGPDGQRKGELDVNTPLEDLQGEIFTLCKDQHGCRYLQKKLEEGVPSYRDMIFAETFTHFTELMTDPFGNYLCQKMLEYCTDEQRNLIVESVAPELVTISLNMHGTRAVQKTIDFLSTSRQIHSIIVALSMNVVTLIKDLNGNHVIQKCLNRLGAEDNQFIYNAVAAHCVEVATHRHGCCVLQRCIDHASEAQRMQLVNEITFNALTLVQDPFGNYVVQYILDLNDPRYSDAVIRQFIGNVCLLSVQKFSSNVIEKCIRVSDASVRKQLIEELLNRARLEKLLRDSFANYVVQTSLDYADPMQRMQLVECIRPILPMIRNTPYGKRIQSKLQRDNVDLGPVNNMPYSLLQAAHQQQLQAMAAMANRQVSAEYPGINMGYGAHGMMHQQMGQQMHHQPPPHLAHHYGGQGPPHLNQHRHPQHHMGGGGPMRGGMQQQHHAPYMGGPQGGAPHMGGGQGMHPNAYGAGQGYNGNMNSFNGMPPQMGMHQQHGGYPGAGYPSY